VREEKGFYRDYCEVDRGVRISVRNWECDWIRGGWIERSQGRPFWVKGKKYKITRGKL